MFSAILCDLRQWKGAWTRRSRRTLLLFFVRFFFFVFTSSRIETSCAAAAAVATGINAHSASVECEWESENCVGWITFERFYWDISLVHFVDLSRDEFTPTPMIEYQLPIMPFNKWHKTNACIVVKIHMQMCSIVCSSVFFLLFCSTALFYFFGSIPFYTRVVVACTQCSPFKMMMMIIIIIICSNVCQHLLFYIFEKQLPHNRWHQKRIQQTIKQHQPTFDRPPMPRRTYSYLHFRSYAQTHLQWPLPKWSRWGQTDAQAGTDKRTIFTLEFCSQP